MASAQANLEITVTCTQPDPILIGTHVLMSVNAVRLCRMPVLLVGSGQDRLLPSLTEQTRLQRLLPNAQRLVLPDSGHTALLEVIPLHLFHCIVATDRSSSTMWVATQHACIANLVLML